MVSPEALRNVNDFPCIWIWVGASRPHGDAVGRCTTSLQEHSSAANTAHLDREVKTGHTLWPRGQTQNLSSSSFSGSSPLPPPAPVLRLVALKA